MNRSGSRTAGWLAKTILGGVVALLGGSPAVAQMTTATSAGGRTTGGQTSSGFGNTSTGGNTSPIAGNTGRTTSGSTSTSGPTSLDTFYNYYGGALAAGFGPSRTLASNTFSDTSSSGGSSASGSSAGGRSGGSSGSSSTGFNSAMLSTTGQNQTLKQNSMNQPLFAVASSSSSNLGGLGTGTATATSSGFSTVGTRRAPPYYTTIAFDVPPTAPVAAVQPDLRQLLDNATTLKSGRDIQVSLDGTTVVLQGTVANDRERRVAEAMVRMNRSVRNVRNEIQVVESQASIK
jgi:hypothetical protein